MTSVITYPTVIDRNEDPPMGLPLPYVAQKKMRSLGLVPFSKSPTRKEWNAYRRWMGEQARKIKEKNLQNSILGVVEGDILTESCLYSLAPKEWLTDSVIQASIKSISSQHVLESSVGFLPHFFYPKLMNEEHSDPEKDGQYDYLGVQTWFKKRFGEGRKVSDMRTLLMFRNQSRMHWVCYGIFLDKKFIQEFDPLGGGDVKALKSIYHWLHDSMESEGKGLTSRDWCLYPTRSNQPMQANGYDCGVFAMMFSLCIAHDLPLNLVQQSIIKRGRCQLWNHLMSLIAEQKELPQESPIDLITPPPTRTSPGFVQDLCSPTVPRRLTYQIMNDGGDEAAENVDEAKTIQEANYSEGDQIVESQTGPDGKSDGGQTGESMDITSGNGGDDPNGDDPKGDDPNDDDPEPSSSKKVRKRRKRRKGKKKGKQQGQSEGTESDTDEEDEDTTQKKKKKPKWKQTESPTRSSKRGKEPSPVDPAVKKKPAWAKAEIPTRSSLRTQKSPVSPSKPPPAAPPVLTPASLKKGPKRVAELLATEDDPAVPKKPGHTKEQQTKKSLEQPPPAVPPLRTPPASEATLAQLLLTEDDESPPPATDGTEAHPAKSPLLATDNKLSKDISTPPATDATEANPALPKKPGWTKAESPTRGSPRKNKELKSAKSPPSLQQPPPAALPLPPPAKDKDASSPTLLEEKDPSLTPDSTLLGLSFEEVKRLSEQTTHQRRVAAAKVSTSPATDDKLSKDDSPTPATDATEADPAVVKKTTLDASGTDTDSSSLGEKEDGTSKKKKAQVAKFRKLTMAHQTSPTIIRKRLSLPTQKKSPEKFKPTKKHPVLPVKKSLKFDSILKTPLVKCPMKKQKNVDLFLNQQEALKTLKQEEL